MTNEQKLVRHSRSGNLKMVKKLLDLGADIHYRNDAPLNSAIHCGKKDVTVYLLENGADPNARNVREFF